MSKKGTQCALKNSSSLLSLLGNPKELLLDLNHSRHIGLLRIPKILLDLKVHIILKETLHYIVNVERRVQSPLPRSQDPFLIPCV